MYDITNANISQIVMYLSVGNSYGPFGEPGYINIGWNYQRCVFDGILLAYRMMNDPAFLDGSTPPPTFSQRYARGKCGDVTIANWVVIDTDPANQYYNTIGPHGPTNPDPPGLYFHITVKNETQNPMKIHLYKTYKADYIYTLAVGEVRNMTIEDYKSTRWFPWS